MLSRRLLRLMLSRRLLRLLAAALALALAVALGATLVPPPAAACPVRIPLGPIAAASSLYQVYRYNGAAEKPEQRWQLVPWQPLRTRGHDTPPDYGMTLSRHFGDPAPPHVPPPCPVAKRPSYQLRNFVGGSFKALYWFSCPAAPQPRGPALVAAPAVTEMRQAVVTDNYYYRYDGENKLLFSSLALAKSSQGSFHKIAAGANQQIVGNFKNFFTMIFDNRDFHVKQLINQPGQVGVYSRLNFLLRVLGMKVDLDLVTEVYFYPEGMYTPMILHMPLDARKYLKRGSGIIYSWEQQPGFTWYPGQPGVPRLADLKNTAKVLKAFCRSACYFSLKGAVAEPKSAVARDIYLHFRIPRYLVAKGFYPVYFADEAKLAKALGLKVTTARSSTKKGPKSEAGRSRTGFFFEAYDLRKGSHRWDLAIDTRQPHELRSLPCGELPRLLPHLSFDARP